MYVYVYIYVCVYIFAGVHIHMHEYVGGWRVSGVWFGEFFWALCGLGGCSCVASGLTLFADCPRVVFLRLILSVLLPGVGARVTSGARKLRSGGTSACPRSSPLLRFPPPV